MASKIHPSKKVSKLLYLTDVLYLIAEFVTDLNCYLTILLLSESNQAKPSSSVDPNSSANQLTDKSVPLDQTSSVNDQPILQDEWGSTGYYDEYTGKDIIIKVHSYALRA